MCGACGDGDADEGQRQQLGAMATGAAAEAVQLPRTYFQTTSPKKAPSILCKKNVFYQAIFTPWGNEYE